MWYSADSSRQCCTVDNVYTVCDAFLRLKVPSLLLPLQGGRYLLPGAIPKSPTRFRFLSWQRLRNCLCKFHSCKYLEPSNPLHTQHPLSRTPPSLFLSSYLSQLFFFDCTFTFVAFTHLFSSCWQTLLPLRSTSTPIYTALSTLPHPPPPLLHSFVPSLLLLPGRIFIVNVNVARGICIATFVWQHSKCSYLSPTPPYPLPHHRTPCAV